MSLAPLSVQNNLCEAKNLKPQFPATVKDSSGSEVVCGDPKYTRALVALMDLGAVNGGAACHWGGPAAAAEMCSAIHAKMFQSEDWREDYNFINDIGHAENGIYALRANLGFGGLELKDLKGFRSIESKLTGHGESHLYPEGVLLSNGPLSSALPQAQGLSMADKLAGKDRVTVCMMSDGASMEGEAKESFAAIPGLAKKGKINPFVLVISDNNTKLGGRISDDSFDMTPTFASMQHLGWKVIKVENGNDLQACYSAFEQAKEESENGPVFVWLKTVKGFGVKSTEESASGGHGFPLKAYSEDIFPFLKEIIGTDIPPLLNDWAQELTKKPESNTSSSSGKTEKVQAGLARGAVRAAKEGKPVVSVSCDLQGSTGMSAFHKEFPDSSFDIGIAESNMVSAAAGMSKAGFLPIVDTFAAFGITKGNLPLVMASLSEAQMIAVFSHTGFQDAADGASHQSLTYISAVSSIPHVKVVIPASSTEAEELMYQAISDIESKKLNGETPDSYIFFVGRENFAAEIEGEKNHKLGSSQVIASGKDGVIVACGPMVSKAIEARDALKEQGKEVGVINLHSINFGDTESVWGEVEKASKKLITIEDHQLIGGMGAQLIHRLKNSGKDFASVSLGVKGTFGQSAYTADQLYSKNGLDAAALVKAFNNLK